MSPVRYELNFISQEKAFFIVTAMKTSDVAYSWVVDRKLISDSSCEGDLKQEVRTGTEAFGWCL
jgi:hypothetical protein